MSFRQTLASAAGKLRSAHELRALIEHLTPKEQEVLTRVVTGCTLEEIGSLLGVSRNTIHFHVKNIYGKLGVSTRAEVTLRAAQLGLIPI